MWSLKRNRRRGKPTRRKHRGGSPECKIDIVVARYKESIVWLKEYADKGFNRVYIYNKGPEEVDCEGVGGAKQCEVIKLPNVGMCDQTYLYHIVENYDKLPAKGVTIFVPASTGKLHYKREMMNKIYQKVLHTKNTVFITEKSHQTVRDELYDFTIDSHLTANTNNRNNTGKQTPSEIRPFGKWYDKYFPGEKVYSKTYWGIFAASTEHIRARPKSFYEGLLSQVSTHKLHEVAHYLERAWTSIIRCADCFYDSNGNLIQGGGRITYTLDIVVARYNEQLEWLKKYANRNITRVFIYNKGKNSVTCEGVLPGKPCEVIKLPNVGVCDQTYLQHIIDRYDKGEFSDVTIFCPASISNPKDTYNKKYRFEKILDLVNDTVDTVFIVDKLNGNADEELNDFTLEKYDTSDLLNRNNAGKQHPSTFGKFGDWYRVHFPREETNLVSYGGIFAVSKKDILSRPKEFYENLNKQVNFKKFHVTSHYLERAWTSVWPRLESMYDFHGKRIGDGHVKRGGSRVPTFHIVIATAGRPQLEGMLNSLKGELNEGDAITIIFDGKSAKKNSGFSEGWKEGFKAHFNTIEQVPGLKHYGHASLNKYAPKVKPVTTFIMFADDDDTYVAGSFALLRSKCIDSDTLYIAKMKNVEKNLIIPDMGLKEIVLNRIGKPNGIIPYGDMGKAEFGINTYTGDFDYYNVLKDKVKNIVFLDDIIYTIGTDGGNAKNGNANA